MKTSRTYIALALTDNSMKLNEALLKLRNDQVTSTEVFELLNQRAVLKDLYIEHLEEEIEMKKVG